MNIFPLREPYVDPVSAGIWIWPNFPDLYCIPLPRKSIMKMLETVTASYVMLKVLEVAVENLLGRQEFWLTHEDLQHISAP